VKGEESFWGFDHLDQVADYLDLERSKIGKWKGDVVIGDRSDNRIPTV
jgi:hypothetical protein